ncbi:MAG: Crp/Fnr family transcriptional regulator [Bacteroidota bacterium]|nr:Crp/Fnr family transcriptional regulator [Bacteroidota bacterium]
MFELLFKSITDKIEISLIELDSVQSFFTTKKLRRKQYLLQEGDVCKYIAFVTKGVLKSYTIDEKGAEHIIQFATEGWWVSDNYSFLTGLAASYTIDAMEDSELLLITHAAMEEMLFAIPKMEKYFRILFQNNIIAIQNRLVCSLTQTAEEKYKKMNDDYPNIIQRVPQHTIASFLGITPETLSRIRKQRAGKD